MTVQLGKRIDLPTIHITIGYPLHLDNQRKESFVFDFLLNFVLLFGRKDNI
jgi:hypothetical protein